MTTRPRGVSSQADPIQDGASERFRTGIGFIAVAAGSAVGLGNMWRFPYMVSERGGAAFLLVYGVLTLTVGIPLLMAEMSVGRRSRRAPPGAFRLLGGRATGWIGVFFIATGVLVSSYYSVIAGWTIRYAIEIAIRGLPSAPQSAFDGIASGGGAFAYTALYLGLILFVLLLGLRRGIERAALVMLPLLVVLLAALAVWVGTLDGAVEGYRFYLVPHRVAFEPSTFVAAAGQAFFSLGLGMGVILTFGSCLRGDEDLFRQAGAVALADLGVAVLAGFVTIPLLLGLRGAPDGSSTIGALFVSMPAALADLGVVGHLMGVGFFVGLALAALTSGIPAMETVTRSLMEGFGWSRRRSAWIATAGVVLLAIPSSLSLTTLGFLDELAGQLFMILGGLALALFVGWRAPRLLDEMEEGASASSRLFVRGVFVMLRWVAPVVITVLLVLSIRQMAS